jgi:serine protease Do
MSRSPFRTAAATLVAILLLSAGSAYAQRRGDTPPGGPAKNNAKLLDVFKPVVAKPSQSTVSVRINDKQVALGAVIATDGYILTKDSELRGDKIIVRLKNGKELPATKVAANDAWDLAMLKVDAKDLAPVTWTPSTEDPVGNWVATPGLGEAPVAVGVVSVAARNMPPGPKLSLPTNPNRGYLGVVMEDAEGGGVKLISISPKSPAEKAGLKPDDVVLSINGKETPDRETLGAMVGVHKPGDKITVRYRRGGEETDVEVTLDKRPSNFPFDRGDFQNSMGTDRSERRTGFPVALQHDTVLKANECGGPLVDLEGRVIGINIARVGRTDTYALPAEAIKPLIADLKAGKSSVSIVPPVASALADKIKAARATLKEAEAAKLAAEKDFAKAKEVLDKLLEEQKKGSEKKK